MKPYMSVRSTDERGLSVRVIPHEYEPHAIPCSSMREFEVDLIVGRHRVVDRHGIADVEFEEVIERHTVLVTVNWRALVKALGQRAIRSRHLKSQTRYGAVVCKIVR